jgi:SAM-dependent methyltransferase
VAQAIARTDSAIIQGILHCPDCRHEYPVLHGIPVIVPDLTALLAERGIELLLRDDLDPALESLLGDAIGPDSWFDVMRQVQSTYAWDAYADLDPAEASVPDGPLPGAVRRCLARLLALAAAAAPPTAVRRVLDVGCAAGRTSFDLAACHPDALVLGVDIHLGLLRIARGAAAGLVSYPRRRIGLAYDRRRFAVDLPADRVDFWACDGLALPFAPGQADLAVALNLLDCVANPRRLLESLTLAVGAGGRILLATPYDWSARATPLASWLGGHSQRAEHAGAGEAFLHALVGGAPEHAIPGLACLAEQSDFPWQTRLHERSAIHYRTHLLALRRQ